MDNKTTRKIQFEGWSKRSYASIRQKVNTFDDEPALHHKKGHRRKKNYCRSKAHEIIVVEKPLGISGHTWKYKACKKCGKWMGSLRELFN